jgi:hypothetical protein
MTPYMTEREKTKLACEAGRELRLKRERLRPALGGQPAAAETGAAFANEGNGVFLAIGPTVRGASYA